MEKEFYDRPGALIIPVPDEAEHLVEGVTQKPLFENTKIMLRQLTINAHHALPQGNLDCDRFYIVLHGNLTVAEPSNIKNATSASGPVITLPEESLAYIPHRKDAATRLRADNVDAVVLEIAIRDPKSKPQALKLDQGTWIDDQLMIITKAEAMVYDPAHHDHTTNHCLLINDDIEVLLSCIDVGGGADVHTHPHEDQCTYVINPGPAKLLHYPKGVEHGGLKNLAQRHDLVLIYYPPQGECLEI